MITDNKKGDMPINRHIPFRCLLPKILFVSRNSDYQYSVCLGIVVATLA